MKKQYRFGSFGPGDRVKMLKGPHSGEHGKVVDIEGHKHPPGDEFGTAEATVQLGNKTLKIHTSHLAPVTKPIKGLKEFHKALVKTILEEKKKIP
jgi:ribosomal protein L24